MNGFGGPRLGAFLRRGGVNALACIGIALLLATMPGTRFDTAVVYSLTIGSLCWLAIDGGRLLVARLLAGADPDGPAAREGWPGARWMAALVVVGVALAYPLGTLIADALTGRDSFDAGTWHGASFPLLVTIIASLAAVASYSASARIASARVEAEAARRAAAETQLKLLESQLEPHMLFNTLANLRVLIGTDPTQAQAMLDRLIAFLRTTLSASRSSAHPLAAEFERLADYLALMAVRLGPRLAVRLDLPDALREQRVPPLLLQPLVENAIRHGIEPKVEGGRIDVVARRDGDRLLLTVRDSGAGLTQGGAPGTRFGLQQVRERLAALYGDAASLALLPVDGGGTLARIELPAATR